MLYKKKGDVKMAATKKTVTATAATKVEEPKTETVKATEAKAEKKETVKKTAAKKETTKKETVKKAPAKKAELNSALHIQFGGKSYSQDDLMKIAKDVWEYDLNQKAEDLTNVELYVKPEENMVYYVMNEVAGSFNI